MRTDSKKWCSGLKCCIFSCTHCPGLVSWREIGGKFEELQKIRVLVLSP